VRLVGRPSGAVDGGAGGEVSDVVRLSVVVPGDDFDEARGEGEDVVPAVEPEEVSGEDPVLLVGVEVGEEPGGDGRHVVFAAEPFLVGIVAVFDGVVDG
jgi:hypothetical protein